jgi:predicted acetyltransferase
MDDEEVALAAREELEADGFDFCPLLEPGMTWSEYLGVLERQRQGEPHPIASSVLVAEVEDTIVGRASIRHALNETLEERGGHIGYAVRPAYRRRGYATAILEQSVVVLRALGVVDVLVTCDDSNVASATVIERCGGVLDSVAYFDDGRPPTRRYWIHCAPIGSSARSQSRRIGAFPVSSSWNMCS